MPILQDLNDSRKRKAMFNEEFEGSVSTPGGGQAAKVSTMDQIRRMLILGNSGDDYYYDSPDKTKDFIEVFTRALNPTTHEEGVDTVEILHMASDIYENSYYLDLETIMLFFVIASMQKSTYNYAYKVYVPSIRNASHFLLFMSIADKLRGYGTGFRNVIESWYNDQNLDRLLFQLMKYGKRWGMDHKSVIFNTRPKLEPVVFDAIMGNPSNHPFLSDVRELQDTSTDKERVLEILENVRGTHEFVNPVHMDADVWKAVISNGIPFHSVLWNLGTFSRLGLLKDKRIMSTIVDTIEAGARNMNVFDYVKAYGGYESGQGKRQTWPVEREILAALSNGFNAHVENITANMQDDRHVVFALDTSGSMRGTESRFPNMNAITAASFALYTLLQTTPNARVMEFHGICQPMPIQHNTTVNEIIEITRNCRGGWTNHSVVLEYLYNHQIPTDVIVFLTDNVQTAGYSWDAAYKDYALKTGTTPAVINLAMQPNAFSALYSEDTNTIELPGFDSLKQWQIALELTK